MAEEAVRIGRRITVVATAATTLEPSRELLEVTAARAGQAIEVRLWMVDDALPALLAGDAALHDRLVVAALREAATESDVIVLAQATMARVLDALTTEPLAIPVLASPQMALAAVRAAIAEPA
jgi:Asp/Glu/hydantoin racemase